MAVNRDEETEMTTRASHGVAVIALRHNGWKRSRIPWSEMSSMDLPMISWGVTEGGRGDSKEGRVVESWDGCAGVGGSGACPLFRIGSKRRVWKGGVCASYKRDERRGEETGRRGLNIGSGFWDLMWLNLYGHLRDDIMFMPFKNLKFSKCHSEIYYCSNITLKSF
jgi:hypothetical protein